MAAPSVTTVKLNTGAEMPIVGLGTWQSEPGKVGAAVETALNAGYKHVDCAAVYGNEPEVGAALTKVFAEGKVKREDIWITSKLWNTKHHPDDVRKACLKTLEDLQIKYLDLYLIHWPCAFNDRGDESETFPKKEDGAFEYRAIPLHKTWACMEALVEEGLVKNIGVSNFPAELIMDVLTYAKIKPAVNQIEMHPYHNREWMRKFGKSSGIHMEAYSPLGSNRELDGVTLLNNPVVKELAEKKGKTPGQILIRYSIDRGCTVLPKSVTPARIISNFEVFDFSLTEEEIDALNKLNRNEAFLRYERIWVTTGTTKMDMPYDRA